MVTPFSCIRTHSGNEGNGENPDFSGMNAQSKQLDIELKKNGCRCRFQDFSSARVFNRSLHWVIFEGLNTTMTVLWQTDADAGISRIEVDGIFRSGDFRTAPDAEASNLTIWAFGDTRTNPATQNQVLGAMLEDIAEDPVNGQSILLHSGDLVANGEDESSWSNEFFPPNQPNILEVQRRMPLMACRGNHEGNGNLFLKYFPYPYFDETAFFYSYDYGPVHITVVDDQSDISPGSRQYDWVKNDIGSSTACWKFVLFHKPAYGVGGHNNDANNQTLTGNLLEPAGVDLVINGHNHYYSRAFKSGLNHVTAGGGGAPLVDPDPDYPFVVVAVKTHNYIRIDLDGNGLLLTALDENGLMLDSFRLFKSCPTVFTDGFESDGSGAWSLGEP